jgi:large subunit ribosomal protein L9
VEVILLEKMRNLGVLGDKVKVKPGFARNFLTPHGKAVYANKANLAKFEERRVELEKKAIENNQKAVARQQELAATPTITIAAKAGEEGKLFGSIGTRDLVEALQKAGVTVEKREIRLPEGAFRMIGEYDVTIELESDVTAVIKFKITPES